MKNKIKFSDKLEFNINDKIGPGNFLNEIMDYKIVKPYSFYKKFIKKMSLFFINKKKSQWNELIKKNKSCNEKLFWQMIYIPPYSTFQLHAHPNIEYDYVVDGNFYEIRCKHIIKDNYCIKNPIGPDISNFSINDFYFNKISKNNALINDIGSVHLSFTKDKHCLLYCLWSGKHANISIYPLFLKNFNPNENILNISKKP